MSLEALAPAADEEAVEEGNMNVDGRRAREMPRGLLRLDHLGAGAENDDIGRNAENDGDADQNAEDNIDAYLSAHGEMGSFYHGWRMAGGARQVISASLPLVYFYAPIFAFSSAGISSTSQMPPTHASSFFTSVISSCS